jgi:hypothetical protein
MLGSRRNKMTINYSYKKAAAAEAFFVLDKKRQDRT